MINVNYHQNANTLAKASLFFLEKKWFFWLSILFINLICILMLLVIIAKGFLVHFELKDIPVILISLLWLFGRKPFHIKLFRRRFKTQGLDNLPIHITISDNGILWSGKGMVSSSVDWHKLKKISKLRNGYLLTTSSTRFLWLPYEGFTSGEDMDNFESLLLKNNVTLSNYPKSAF